MIYIINIYTYMYTYAQIFTQLCHTCHRSKLEGIYFAVAACSTAGLQSMCDVAGLLTRMNMLRFPMLNSGVKGRKYQNQWELTWIQ